MNIHEGKVNEAFAHLNQDLMLVGPLYVSI